KRIDCRFTRPPRFLVTRRGASATLTAFIPNSRSGLRITIAPTGSVASYDPQACRLSAAPR
ncbi:MAG: hypothetical protein AB1416_08275, partial [Actinomycetota bacterium]